MSTYLMNLLINCVQLFLDLNLIVENNETNKFIPTTHQIVLAWIYVLQYVQ